MDFVYRSLVCGEHVYVISFDIVGAFDNVSHQQLPMAMRRFGVDFHSLRLARNWLEGRQFRVTFNSPTCIHLGELTEISSGLPQGGVFSPLPWLLSFNDVVLNRARPSQLT